MLKQERQAYILKQLDVHNKVLTTDLCSSLAVSEDTVRRDLQDLAEAGKLHKVHGGALSTSFQYSLQPAPVYHQLEKQNIAQKGINLMRDGMLVLLSGGTTILQMVKALPPDLQVTFMTISIPVALELMNHPRAEVIFIGNRLNKNTKTAVGSEVVARLEGVRADLCFLGTNSIDVEAGVTDSEWEIIDVKRAMIAASDRVVSLAISEKLNTVQKFKVCGLDEIDYIATELPYDAGILECFAQTGIGIL